MDFSNNILQIELQLLDGIAAMRTAWLDAVVPVISSFGDKGIGWIIVAVVLACIPKYRKAGITMGLALIFCLLVGNMTLKPLIARPRPYTYVPEMTLLVAPLADFSFPSGHTFASFAAATALFLHHKKLGIAAYILAAVIAFTRLYLYVHFPSDVAAGMLLGILGGWIAYRIVQSVSAHKKI